MAPIYLLLLLSAGLCITGVLSDCTPGYDATANTCYAGKYLCPSNLCACPGSTGAANYDCYSPTVFGCPASSGNPNSGLVYGSKDNSNGICPNQPTGSTSGDPLVQGFDGCPWYLHGKPGAVMNLVSEARHVVNTQLVPANLTDEHHGGEGTFHGTISVRFLGAIVTASLNAEGHLTVFLDDRALPFESTYEESGLTVKVAQFYPYYGQVAEIVTPAFRFFIHAVQPYDSPGGWSRGHLDLTATMTAADLKMHGLLGQSIHRAGSLCTEDYAFHGEGDEQDYTMASLNSVDFIYSQFATSMRAARRLQADGAAYKPIATPVTAFFTGTY